MLESICVCERMKWRAEKGRKKDERDRERERERARVGREDLIGHQVVGDV